MKKISHCFKKHNHEAPRNWWERPYVVYSFNNPRVRSLIERLMGTDVVRITDREFMMELQKAKREYHEKRVQKIILDRMVGEVERVKLLILKGKMPVEQVPKELSEHPVFKITQQINKIMAEEKYKARKKRRSTLKVDKFNYDKFKSIEEEVVDAEISSCIELNMSEAERDWLIQNRDDYITEGLGTISDEDLKKLKYAEPLVKELQDAEGVNELYKLADEIVGHNKFK